MWKNWVENDNFAGTHENLKTQGTSFHHRPAFAKPYLRAPSKITTLISVFLLKLAKHLAFIACLTIVGGATGHPVIGQATIFLLVVLSALLHSFGLRLKRRMVTRLRV